MLYLLIKKYNLLFLFTLLLMSGNEVVAQSSSNLNSGKTFSRFDENVELKEKIYQLKYSDPNLAISICLNSLEDYIPLGPSLFTLYLYSTLGELYLKKDLPVLSLSYLEDAMYEYELIKKEGIEFSNSQPTQQPWLTINIGNIFFNQGQYEKALERYELSMSYFSQLDSLLPKIRGLSTTYNNIALIHIELQNYNLALENITKAYNLREKYNFNPIDIAHSFKSFSELYFIWNMQEKGNLYLAKTDSINKLIQEQKSSTKFKDYDDLTFKLLDNYLGNCYEYKGEYLSNQKRYNQALEAYNKASSYYGEFAFQKVSLINKKANVYYMLAEYENCLKAVEECILLSKEQNLQKQIEIALELKIKALNKLGLSSKIELLVEEILKNKDYRYSIQISQLLSGLESKNDILLKKREIEEEKAKNSRIVFISIIIILILAFATAYFISRKVYLDKQMIIVNQNEKIAKSELEHKKRELAAISTNIVQENEQVSNILKDLKYYSSLLKSEKDRNSFSPLIKSINRILSEKRKEDLYSDQFNAAYPGYLEYLTRTYPDLTTADLKLCTFLRMNLNTKEIAEIMGLSVRSVESRRYRLRKKLNLSKEEDLVSNLISLKY
jgi:tetratricopeptide (TPR) repeat protein